MITMEADSDCAKTEWRSFPLLRLPLELRQQIYGHLLAQQVKHRPLPSIGITSVSHQLPSITILLINSQLTNEILDYFYGSTTWSLVLSHELNYYRVDPDLLGLESSQILKRVRKVEIEFFCDGQKAKSYPSFGVESFCLEVQRRAHRACEVLSQATDLRTVIVSWSDTTQMDSWNEKVLMLTPLRSLAEAAARLDRPITFIAGPFVSCQPVKRDAFVRELCKILDGFDILGSANQLQRDEQLSIASAQWLGFRLPMFENKTWNSIE